MKGRVLVTGAAGFLGSNVVRLLLEAGYEVVGLKKKNNDLSRLGNFANHNTLAWQNFEDGLENCFVKPVDVIVHLATSYGRDNETYADVATANLVMPLTLLEMGLKNKVKAFVNADTFFNVKLGLRPREKSYIATKKLFLELAKDISKEGIKFANMRIEQMYGPGDNQKKFVTTVLGELLSGAKEIKLTKGNQKRDFIYVEDAAQAFVAAVEKVAALPMYHEFGVGTGKSVSIKKVVTYLKKVTKSKADLAWGALPMRKHEMAVSKANVKSNALLKWKAKIPWEKGMQKTLNSLLLK